MSEASYSFPTRDEIVDGLREVPAVPVASLRVVQLLQDAGYNPDQLVQCIEYDPGLTSAVLRLANSALLGGARNVASIREAVLRLGAKRISQMVMTSSVGSQVRTAARGYDDPADKIWKHSVATALGAETLAARADILAPPYTFTAGLLHNIGKTILGNHLGVDARPIVKLSQAEKISFEEAERRLLGIDHAELGALLLELWSLPTEIVEVVRHHHTPGALGEADTTVDLVHLADLFGLMCGFTAKRDGHQYRASRETLGRIPLSKTLAERVMKDTVSEMENLRGMFELERVH